MQLPLSGTYFEACYSATMHVPILGRPTDQLPSRLGKMPWNHEGKLHIGPIQQAMMHENDCYQLSKDLACAGNLKAD